MSATTSLLNCSCGDPLIEFKRGPSTVVGYKCRHCDELCPLPRDTCAKCERSSRTDNHNKTFTPKGKSPKIKDNGEGMPGDPPALPPGK